MTIDDARRTSFDRDAARYDSARPSYPDAMAAALRARAPGDRLLEIGAGTGKATEVLARAGFAITALEPGANLAAILRAKALPRVQVEETTFEAWRGDDASFDVVVAAQAIHWIDPAVRYAKSAALLRAGGVLAIVRNDHDEIDRELRAELDAAYAGVLTGDRETFDSHAREYSTEIAASGRFGPAEISAFRWTVRYPTHAYLDLLATHSDHALLAHGARARLFAAIARAIDRRGGTIDIPYVTMLLVAPRHRIE